ncbi:TetR family transcriptional regulator [Phenylobacterium sp. LH3H17]|uniref:TetR/AcrR family transcriptional regulator C-terminal domain-containing protein n=1 Tax=Phenylobacterium sp. LH3H17 TaxID=2903901 RepID=UPI0020C994F5|nr:TetR/AcrR family transcriptional regulator C-terminal domain-containing protein [Phenylobacterium sp. LH3H17]UTP39089.1 TetR family transcriptional regulator [Phenylobacterium sp. LH3H17]
MLNVLSLAEKRAMREPGKRMRSRLLDAAVELFKAKGLAGVSVAEIAAAAGAFPSQVTYYFRTKEALFVEAACREVLYVARQAETAAASAVTGSDYNRSLVETVIGSPGLALFVDALSLTRRRQDLAPLIERTFDRLHGQGDRAFAEVRQRRGWSGRDDPATTARRFWTLALGVALRDGATEVTGSAAVDEMLAMLGHARIAGGHA